MGSPVGDPSIEGAAPKVSAEEASEHARQLAADVEAKEQAAAVAIKPGDYQIHVHVIMVRRFFVVACGLGR